MNSNYSIVRREVQKAYADCISDSEQAYEQRDLNFLSSLTVTVKDAIRILREVVPSYNEFEPANLRGLDENAQLYIAREGSVCVYVLGEKPTKTKKLLCDEFNYYPIAYQKKYGPKLFVIPGPVTRIWWD